MSGIHRTWIDSWDKTKNSILNGEVTEEQAAKLVYQRKFRNTLSKKRQRNRAHVSGPKDDSNEQVVFETTLVAEKGQTKDDLSPLARRIADGVFEMVKEGLPADGTLGTNCGLRLHHSATQILAANR